MKIRLESINGRISDPLYNEKMIEDAIAQAEQDSVDLLVFPVNSIRPESAKDIEDNQDYSEAFEEALSRLEVAEAEAKLSLTPHGMPQLEGYPVVCDIDPELESIEKIANRAEEARLRSAKEKGLVIVCKGRGTESGCSGAYSNAKIIAFCGEILGYSVGDRLDVDFDPIEKEGKFPYLTGADCEGSDMFEDILEMQSEALWQKMKSMNRFKICMGISGGLDSTVSLLVCCHAFRKHGLPMKDIIGATMPGFGTTKDTYEKSLKLMNHFGITALDIDLKPLLTMHLDNIKQPEGVYDVTYEQTQSRERTQVLLDLANKENAIMIGTGCMSEFALGWMTYGGDHLSMFAVNIGLPKTVVKMYAKWFADKSLLRSKDGDLPAEERKKHSELAATILSVLHAPVSPELLPVDDKGVQHEKTESLVGDYAVQDFFIYHTVVRGMSIRRMFEGACKVFPEHSKKEIFAWLKTFVLRFYTRQYKKNCYGDGVQIFDYSMSPITGYRMASDVGNWLWEKELKKLEKEIA